MALGLGFRSISEENLDIVAADLVPKPDRRTYERFVNRFDMFPERAAMFEDLARNLLVPSLGMTTTLVVPQEPATCSATNRNMRAATTTMYDYYFVTDDIGRFLERVADAVAV